MSLAIAVVCGLVDPLLSLLIFVNNNMFSGQSKHRPINISPMHGCIHSLLRSLIDACAVPLVVQAWFVEQLPGYIRQQELGRNTCSLSLLL
jgi:hypothetical protein